GIAGEDRVVQQGGRSWSAENGTTQESFTSQAPTGIVSQGTTAQKEDPPVENGGPRPATLDSRRVAGEGGFYHVERAAVTDGTRAAPYPSAVFEKRAGRDRHGAPVEDRARPFGAVMDEGRGGDGHRPSHAIFEATAVKPLIHHQGAMGDGDVAT